MTPRPTPASRAVILAALDAIDSELFDLSPDVTAQHSFGAFRTALFSAAECHGGEWLQITLAMHGRAFRLSTAAVERLQVAFKVDVPRIASRLVREWVVSEGVRFPAKEDQEVMVRLDGVPTYGTCIGAMPSEARGIFRYIDTTPRVITVPAEDVAKVKIGAEWVDAQCVSDFVGFQIPEASAA